MTKQIAAPADRPKLHQRFQMHTRMSGGSIMTYALTRGNGGPVVGHKSVFHPNERAAAKGKSVKAGYTLGDKEFTDSKSPLAAHEQMLRDDEWEAAAPAPPAGRASRRLSRGC